MSIIFNHDWTAVADTPAGAAGSTAGADQDGGWTDRAGGQVSVSGGRLRLAGTGDSGALVSRPTSEAVAHGRARARIDPADVAGVVWFCPRVTDPTAGHFYAIRCSLDWSGSVTVDAGSAFVGFSPGGPVSFSLTQPSGTLATDVVDVEVEAGASVGGSTDYVVTIRNVTRRVFASATISDATPELQAPGAVGFLSHDGAVAFRAVSAESVGAAAGATIVDQDWSAVADTPAGAAGTGSGADQDGLWTDREGGIATVSGGRLVLLGGGAGSLVYRPMAEATAHAKLTATIGPIGATGATGEVWLCPRVVDPVAGNFLGVGFQLMSWGAVANFAYRFHDAGLGPNLSLSGVREPPGTAAGDVLTLAVEAETGATSPAATDYTVTIANVTRGTMAGVTVSEGTPELQAPGAVAFLAINGGGAYRTATVADLAAGPEPVRHRMRLRAGAGGGVAILT